MALSPLMPLIHFQHCWKCIRGIFFLEGSTCECLPARIFWDYTGKISRQNHLTLQGICWRGCVVNESRDNVGKAPFNVLILCACFRQICFCPAFHSSFNPLLDAFFQDAQRWLKNNLVLHEIPRALEKEWDGTKAAHGLPCPIVFFWIQRMVHLVFLLTFATLKLLGI